ncbi:MAG: hypothetical protein BWZ07_03154 [Alphaproteobacteria bacterium ADurb.BinA280]|nr:MAG: hypothetical protein BWZ07_03154 [Alphaproteobacteria bacterium ADurb.BinA280]
MIVDHLYVAAFKAVSDVARHVPNHIRIQHVGGVVLGVEKHEGFPILVGVGGLATHQVEFFEVVVGAQAEVELAAAGNAVQGETEGDIATACGGRTAFDVADLVDRVVVFDDGAFSDVTGFHGGVQSEETAIVADQNGNRSKGAGRRSEVTQMARSRASKLMASACGNQPKSSRRGACWTASAQLWSLLRSYR